MLVYWIVVPIIWVLEHLVWRIEVRGRENLIKDRGFVIACNHISLLDPVFIVEILFKFRPMYILAKEELFHNPLLGWFLTCVGAVAVDRGKGDMTVLDKVADGCKNGRGLLIFPEGTRTKDPHKLGMLKGGAFVAAGKAGVDMIPCRIMYNTPDGKLHLFCRIRVCFGAPIPAGELEIEDPKHSIAALRGMKNKLKTDLEALYEENKFESKNTEALQ